MPTTKRKQKSPSKKLIQKLLSESVFDPRDASPMSLVVSMNDPSYCESKAIELIIEGKDIQRNLNDPRREISLKERCASAKVEQVAQIKEAFDNETKRMRAEYNEKLMQATSLLALARALRSQDGPV